MSCWLFFVIMYTRGVDIPPACEFYIDDPLVQEVVELPRYIVEDAIDSNGDAWYIDQA